MNKKENLHKHVSFLNNTSVVMKPKFILLVWLIFLSLYHKYICHIPPNIIPTHIISYPKETTHSFNTGSFTDSWFPIVYIVFTFLELYERKENSIQLGQRVERKTLKLQSHLRKHWLEVTIAYGTHTALPGVRDVFSPPEEQCALLHQSQGHHSYFENCGQKPARSYFFQR